MAAEASGGLQAEFQARCEEGQLVSQDSSSSLGDGAGWSVDACAHDLWRQIKAIASACLAADDWGTTSASTVDTVDVSRTEEDMAQEDSPLGGGFDVLLTVNSPARGATYFAFQGPWRRRGFSGLGLWGGPME